MKLGFELHTTDICISRALNRMIDESVARPGHACPRPDSGVCGA